jgi:hypothetical protein
LYSKIHRFSASSEDANTLPRYRCFRTVRSLRLKSEVAARTSDSNVCRAYFISPWSGCLPNNLHHIHFQQLAMMIKVGDPYLERRFAQNERELRTCFLLRTLSDGHFHCEAWIACLAKKPSRLKQSRISACIIQFFMAQRYEVSKMLVGTSIRLSGSCPLCRPSSSRYGSKQNMIDFATGAKTTYSVEIESTMLHQPLMILTLIASSLSPSATFFHDPPGRVAAFVVL